MKKKIIVSLVCFSLVSSVAVGYVFSKSKTDALRWGQQNKIASEQATGETAFTVNGISYPLERYEAYKRSMENSPAEYTEQEILNRYIKQKLIFQEAERRGITVSDSEAEAFTKERFSGIDSDPEAKKIIEDYIQGAGLTLDEYMQQSNEISKQALLGNKLRKLVIEEALSQKATDQPISYEEGNSIFDGYIEVLKKVADIQIINELLVQAIEQD